MGNEALNQRSYHNETDLMPRTPAKSSTRRPSDMKVGVSLTNALLQELVKTYERQDKEKRKENLDFYFRARSQEIVEIKVRHREH